MPCSACGLRFPRERPTGRTDTVASPGDSSNRSSFHYLAIPLEDLEFIDLRSTRLAMADGRCGYKPYVEGVSAPRTIFQSLYDPLWYNGTRDGVTVLAILG